MIDELILWLTLEVFASVVLGWWIQGRITEARLRRLVVEL